jgi:hypothetical protein
VLVMPFYLGFTLIAAVLVGPFVGIINGMMLLLVTQARQTV